MNLWKSVLTLGLLLSSLTFAQENCKANLSLSLNEYLDAHNQKVTEGYVSSRTHLQVEFFTALLQKNSHIQNIAEIGFNAGHSSDLFLKTLPSVKVLSFDIMEHGYARVGKEYVDLQYPSRHHLIEGNSLVTVPSYHKENPESTFDLIFIDGGHDFKTALNDIINMKSLSSAATLLVMDDIKYKPVLKAWEQCLQNGLIKEVQRYSGGGKAWVVGQYVW